jgi:hypothetical protein
MRTPSTHGLKVARERLRAVSRLLSPTLHTRALLLLTLAAALSAQRGDLQGPLLGLSFAPDTGEIRTIWGAPGAATQGQAIRADADNERTRGRPKPDRPITQLAVAPSGKTALAIRSDALLQVDLAGFQLRPIENTLPAATMLAYSPTGAFAVVFYDHNRTIQVLRLTGAQPEVDRQWQIDHPAAVASLAVSDDGNSVLTGMENASLLLWERDAPYPAAIGEFVVPSALAFLPGTSDVVIGDSATRTISLLTDITGARQILLLAENDQGIRQPVAIRAAAGGKRIVIADRKARAAIILDRTSGEVTTLPCECIPTGLDSLTDPRFFRLTDSMNEPLWMVDSEPAGARLVFVPPNRDPQ